MSLSRCGAPFRWAMAGPGPWTRSSRWRRPMLAMQRTANRVAPEKKRLVDPGAIEREGSPS